MARLYELRITADGEVRDAEGNLKSTEAITTTMMVTEEQMQALLAAREQATTTTPTEPTEE